ncbi:MAG TPA: thioesterase domain-containing protein [Clostridia bacterium]|nr:thioesterase domain-containing protein [Clostridia bacterium]
MKLFCFPYAGGSASIYYPFKNYLDKTIELYPVELAGRGKRCSEPMPNTMDEMVWDVFEAIKDEIAASRYAFFGYSMGSVIAYELCLKIKKYGLKGPEHVFVAARGAPNVVRHAEQIHNLNNTEFLEKIKKTGGTPKEFFDNTELVDFYLPVLKGDYKVIEEYETVLKTTRIDCDITVLDGTEDNIPGDNMTAWKELTNKKSIFYQFEGDHFFIKKQTKQIVDIINRSLL